MGGFALWVLFITFVCELSIVFVGLCCLGFGLFVFSYACLDACWGCVGMWFWWLCLTLICLLFIAFCFGVLVVCVVFVWVCIVNLLLFGFDYSCVLFGLWVDRWLCFGEGFVDMVDYFLCCFACCGCIWFDAFVCLLAIKFVLLLWFWGLF